MEKGMKTAGLKLNVKFTLVIIVALVIPIAVFSGVLFFNLEQNAIETNMTSMEYKRELNISNINNCIDSVNMATQFFLSDSEMKNVLVRAAKNQTLTTEELVSFKESDITNLERLVSNNPLLYSVRVFSANDNVQEMMPILYKNTRMLSLNWNADSYVKGWHYGYTDNAFSSLLTNQNDELVCLVSPITDYKAGTVGVVEASVKMSTIFPTLYENSDNEWSAFVGDDGRIHLGRAVDEATSEEIKAICENALNSDKTINYIVMNGRKLVVAVLEEKEIGGNLVFIRDITGDINHIYLMRNIFIVMMIILLIGISFGINHIVSRMLRQFYSILKSMKEVQDGNLDVRIEHCSNDEMGQLGTQLNEMLDTLKQLMEDNINREVLVKDSEIRALQNQINAHFIYNVLESIKMMAEIDEEYEISDSITSLGKLLRYSMRWVSGNVSVAEELDYIKNYMALINLRYDFVVNLSVNIPESMMTQEIPKMSLQPIVENAILHGIDPIGQDSTIYIKGISDGKDCIIEITDTGKGMNAKAQKALEEKIQGTYNGKEEKGNGIGLHNVQNRIKMSFGEEYGMTISTSEGCYTKVAIRLPFRSSCREGLK